MLLKLFTFFAVTAIPIFTFSQVNLNNGLMAYYPFNGNANDASGNGNNPVFNNAALTSDYYGKPNRAYHFNGVDNYIEIPNSNSLNTGNAISICAWVKPTGFYTGPCYNNMIVAKQTADYVTGDYALRYSDVVNGCTINADSNKEVFYGSDGGAGNLQSYIKRNQWYNVVFTSDGIRAKLYVNCKLIVDQPASLNTFGNTYNLFLGHMDNSNYPYWLNGDLDEVRIYNRALNADEVEAYSFSCGVTQNLVTAGFTSPDTVCTNTPLKFLNTSKNASNYYWNFCAADFNTTPVGSNLGNFGGDLSAPVFMDYILDDDGNYYGFVTNYNYGHLIKLSYGNSLLNTPTAQDLGTLGVIPPYAEGIQVKKFNGKCYVFVVSGGDIYGTSSVLVRVDFGNSFGNTPTANNLGNIGDLNFPHDLFITEDDNNFYGFTVNINDNTITRFNFGNNLSNTPSGTNLGNVGNLNYPCGFSFINSNGTWYAFVTNRNSNSISRLSFGAYLINDPSGVNIGDPGNFLNKPRDISLFESCSGIAGLVVNEENEQTGTITKLSFNADITSKPAAKNLGNIGNITFPHSISKFFLQGNDIYSFIPNVTTNTLTRIRYIGCNSSNIPSSTLQTPPSVTYDKPGVYNVNLLVDIGLPTETSFCKQIVVKNCNNQCDSFKVNAGKNLSICYGASTQLNATGAAKYNWSASTALNDTTIANPVAKPLITTQFIVTGYDSAGTCSNKDTVKISVLPLPVFTLNNDTSVCNGSILQLNAISQANYHYHWSPAAYLSDTSIANPVSASPDTIRYFVTAADSDNCRSTDSIQINVVPKPVISTISDTSICFGSSIVLSTNANNASHFIWSPSSGLNNSSIQSPQATPLSTATYIVTASNTLCSAQDSVRLTVSSLPIVSAGNDTVICAEGIAQLHASGALSYVWYPDINLTDTVTANPFAFPSSTTTYYVKGTDNNNCLNTDSVVVSKQANPVFSINVADSSICSGKSVSLIAAGGDLYQWSPSQTLSDSTSATTTAHPSSTTQYSVYIYDSTCRTSATLNSIVEIKPSPNPTVTKSNDIDCTNLSAQLNATDGASYSWSPADYINNTKIANPVVEPPSDTKYTVTITDTDKCVASASVVVKSTVGNIGFYVANAFTPNGDGLNDCFGLRYWGIPATFDMMIFDKWGMPVYHSKNISECWNGTYNGKKQGSGVYVYMITATSICGQSKVFKKGTIVLMR